MLDKVLPWHLCCKQPLFTIGRCTSSGVLVTCGPNHDGNGVKYYLPANWTSIVPQDDP